MASSKASGVGVPKTRSATKEKEKENTQKLQNAVNGNMSDAKAQLANSQSTIVEAARDHGNSQSQDGSVESQSKPQYGLHENVNQAHTVELQDSDMGEASKSHSAGNSSSDLETVSSQSSAPSPDDDSIYSLFRITYSPQWSAWGGGWFWCFERTNACSTEGFKNLSYHRISALRYEDDRGEMHYYYERENLKGVTGIAIEERDETQEYKNANQTWIKVKWKGIRKEHRKLLCKLAKDDNEDDRHSSWIPRTDLIRIIGRKATDIQLKGIWDAQEKRHLEGLTGLDRTQRAERERLRSLSAAPKRFPSPHPVKQSLDEPVDISEPRMTRTQPLEPAIKEEEPESDSLFVSAEPPTKETHASDPDEPNPEVNKAHKEPLRFSFASFIEGASKREKWSQLSDDEREERLAAAEARWDRYKQLRLQKGDICEDDEL
ncbi:hypothetical protein ASPFODRAFT_35900 [Aspergillus luchuensis CBS 106.47]|uniref:Uncharacterized protein n=1 Tax=Aspergillus luchuensis (strain CBS 106.47) TaxID=1137211 RepID=A0A1M3T9E7_ASPLC|nr:hypothetical protein ASPFODRAFT_35900 [Aspergillus luchuensis CBS 106.47]